MLKSLFLLWSLYSVGYGKLEVLVEDVRTPVVVTTWAFKEAADKAWQVLYEQKGLALDAVERGCSECEYQQCDYTVGFGGSPDENGETTLDAMIMDGTTMNVGAVGGLKRIKNAIGVARNVLDKTRHSLLVGDAATNFAREMGFKEENLTTKYSADLHHIWMKNKCQPNFRINVSPNPATSCGPYNPIRESLLTNEGDFEMTSHDTIGMVAVDSQSRVASATSTNGAKFKVPGRVGDSPIPGSGSYADGNIGAAAATGDGDVMMRFLPSFLAVEEMKRGKSPEEAAQKAIDRIFNVYPNFKGAVITLRKDGAYGAACHGLDSFPYVVANPAIGKPIVFYKTCHTKDK